MKIKQNILSAIITLLSLVLTANINAQKHLNVYASNSSEITRIALDKLEKTQHIQLKKLDNFKRQNRDDNHLVLLTHAQDKKWIKKQKLKIDVLKSEGFQIIKKNNCTYLIGYDDKGLMYGILGIRDHLQMYGSLDDITEKTENPHFSFRAVKFNLPWSSYRIGESLFLHMETVKDTAFWEGYLDMMAENKFNTLTLWNLHPFTFMIQPKNYPEATQFTGQEFRDWQTFWRTLFRMAKNRGIETYIINWNIITSPGMTEAHNVANYKDDLEWHYGFTPADTSQVIVDYMRDCITQTINEYPNLTGVGVSVGERMKMPMEDAMKWIQSTFVEGLRNANRKAKFIHRAPFKVEPETARKYIESYGEFDGPIIMEFKFNWSHSHSSPNLSITHGGKVADQYWNPKPSNYKMAWMMRNEDFLMLNWGQTEFIRNHIKTNDFEDITAGYFIGSETYIPAKEYRMKQDVNYNWKYAYEKDWELYSMWGNLLYNPELPDSWFIERFNHKYGPQVGKQLFEALQLGSQMPLDLASFYQGTWDFTLYCEAFLNGKQIYRNYKEAGDAFIRIDEMIKHPSLDPKYLNIDTYTNRKIQGDNITEEEVTPLEIAKRMEKNGHKILELCSQIENKPSNDSVNFKIEVNDVKSWAHLSLYFASKLRAGMHMDMAMKTQNKPLKQKSIEELKKAAEHWQNLIQSTNQYQEVSLLHIRSYKFSWKLYYPQVLKDIEIAESINL